MIEVYDLEVFRTSSSKSKVDNGLISPLWKDYDDPNNLAPRYVYYTTCSPKSIKGPYKHTKRAGLLCFISGKIIFVYKENNKFKEVEINTSKTPKKIYIPNNTEYVIINIGNNDAVAVNICNYPWIKDDNETITPNFSDYNFNKWGDKIGV